MSERLPLSPRVATWAMVGLLEAPLVGLWVCTQFFSPANISLVGDLAIADHNARLAQHGGMYVGVYDRYGWNHPGPILSYLQGGAYWLFGSSARTLFATSIMVVAVSIAGSAAVLIRNCSTTAARFGVLGLGLFLIWMGTATVGWASDSVGSLFLSP